MVSTDGAEQPASGQKSTGRLGFAGIGLLALFVYVVAVGGTASGEVDPTLRLINAALSLALIVTYLIRARTRSDWLDRNLIVALVLFATAGVLSRFARQSFDAVLAAMTYAAALFVARDLMARQAMRRAFVPAMTTLSLLFTMGAAVIWLGQLFEWWRLAGETVLPPLDIQLSAGPWGHRYDMALLVVMLYPAWWVGRPSLLRKVAAVSVGLLALMVVIITGSRTTWLAVGTAAIVIVAPSLLGRWRQLPGQRWLYVAVSSVAVLGVAGALLVSPLGERLSNLASLDWRLAMWEPLVQLWLQQPVAGIGPGGFPWALQLTEYFDGRTWAPRHPDNAIMQVLPEAGLLGLAALILVGVSVISAVFAGSSRGARWSISAFATACIGANPTDFAFLIAVAIAWTAYATPHREVATRNTGVRRHPVRLASGAALGIVSLAYAATVVGSFAYEAGRRDAEQGRFTEAASSFRMATTLDPSMALYHRQLGVATMLTDQRAVVDHLERAVALNPSDDLAWRSLAIARETNRSGRGVADALGAATDAQRADPTNMLLAGSKALAAGNQGEGVAILAEVVQAWPAIVGAPGWDSVLGDSIMLTDVIDAAATRWFDAGGVPELPFDQGIWLGVLADRPDIVEAATDRDPIDQQFAAILASQLRCDPSAAEAFTAVDEARKRSSVYWSLRVRQAGLAGELDVAAAQMLHRMTGSTATPEIGVKTINPVNENTALSADRWGYRRASVSWPVPGLALPSVDAGNSAWLFDPRGAAALAGLSERLPQC